MPNPNPFNRSFEHLEALADTIGEVLRSAVTIEDARHRLLAYSKHDVSTDAARIATIIGRRVPDHVIGSLWTAGVIPRLMETDEPVRVGTIGEVGLGKRAAIAIRKDKLVLGYIWVLEGEHPLDEHDMQALKLASAAARVKLLHLKTQRSKEEEERRDLFWELLTGHYGTLPQARAKTLALGIALPPAYGIALLQFCTELTEARQQQLFYMVTTAREALPIVHVVSGRQLIVLVGSSEGRSFPAEAAAFVGELARQAGQRFGQKPLQTGIGGMCDDIGAVEQSYKEARTVVQIQEQFPTETTHMLHYDDLGYYRYLPYFLEHKRAHRYENPSLKRLKAYDREHHANLLETLEVFLSADGNAKEAADILHVHPNTLAYRLKRIAEIGQIRFGDVDQKMTLFLDLKTEKWSRAASDL